jgi:hypothetical protein
MLESFKAALARAQSDYDFYIGCQTDPESTLADYDLSHDERAALTNPDRLAEVLKQASSAQCAEHHRQISGPRLGESPEEATEEDEPAAIRRQVEEIEQAKTKDERTKAAISLMELIG